MSPDIFYSFRFCIRSTFTHTLHTLFRTDIFLICPLGDSRGLGNMLESAYDEASVYNPTRVLVIRIPQTSLYCNSD